MLEQGRLPARHGNPRALTQVGWVSPESVFSLLSGRSIKRSATWPKADPSHQAPREHARSRRQPGRDPREARPPDATGASRLLKRGKTPARLRSKKSPDSIAVPLIHAHRNYTQSLGAKPSRQILEIGHLFATRLAPRRPYVHQRNRLIRAESDGISSQCLRSVRGDRVADRERRKGLRCTLGSRLCRRRLTRECSEASRDEEH
jgi:hypothetical protein